MFSFAIVLLQEEFNTYRTTFYPISISGGSFFFLMKTKSLSDKCFESVQNRSDTLKTCSLKLAKNVNSANSHVW